MSKKSKCPPFIRKREKEGKVKRMLHRFLVCFSVMRVVSKVCYQGEFCECRCFVWLPQDSGVYENTARGRDLSWDLHTNTVPTRVISFPSFDQCQITFTPSHLILHFPSGVTFLSLSSAFFPPLGLHLSSALAFTSPLMSLPCLLVFQLCAVQCLSVSDIKHYAFMSDPFWSFSADEHFFKHFCPFELYFTVQ